MFQRTFDCGEQGEVANELRRLLLECHPGVAAAPMARKPVLFGAV